MRGPGEEARMGSHRWTGVHGCRVEPKGKAGATVGDTEVPRLASQLAIASDFSDLTKVGSWLSCQGQWLARRGLCQTGEPTAFSIWVPTQLLLPVPWRSSGPVWTDPAIFQEKLEI